MKRWFAIVVLTASILATSCTPIGPNYSRPPAPAPPAFKEQPPEGFKTAQPSDSVLKGKWWEIYNDPVLNALEEQISVSNQNVRVLEAQFREAKAAVQVARSGLYPVLTGGASATGSRSAALSSAATGRTGSTYSIPFTASWEPDFWGNIRRGINANADVAQATFADLENARLLFQSQLAEDYFQLHGIDGEMALLNRTVSSYQEYLTLTRNRFAGGVASDLDVAQAESQLDGAQSTLIDLGVQRAQLEHGIAILIGKPPSEFSVDPVALFNPPPPIPIGVPSELLQRRPDIAAAERQVAAANEQIGIAMAAFYPTLTLGASLGLESFSIAKFFTWPSRVWSVGPSLAETLFDAGRRRAIVAEQQAAYDATVAQYRQTVLTAFQQVEDNIAALRVLEQEAGKLQETIQAADRALTVSTAQYKAGTTVYLTVITEQATLLGAQVSAVQLLTRRMTASVGLVQALGGGWDASKLPPSSDLVAQKHYQAAPVR